MDFYKRVEFVCDQIPYGKVATYGQIALLCQKPQNSRQVGYALNKKDCGGDHAHRVVNGRGVLSGAGAFGEGGEQKRRLMEEGIEVIIDQPRTPGRKQGSDGTMIKEEQQVDIRIYGWKTTMKDALWFIEEFRKREI